MARPTLLAALALLSACATIEPPPLPDPPEGSWQWTAPIRDFHREARDAGRWRFTEPPWDDYPNGRIINRQVDPPEVIGR